MWRRAFIAAAVAWAAALPLAAWIAARPASPLYAIAFAVYAAGSVVCHQWPERSFHLWAAQMPVCARCTGIYFAAALMAVAATGARRLRAFGASARLVLAAAVAPTVATLAFEWATGHTPANWIRFAAGLPGRREAPGRGFARPARRHQAGGLAETEGRHLVVDALVVAGPDGIR